MRLLFQDVETLVSIGSLMSSSEDIQGGRPIITGTGRSVRRIVALYKQGYSTDEIVSDKDYLTLAQVHAALAYYYINQQVIDQNLAEQAAEYEKLSAQVSQILTTVRRSSYKSIWPLAVQLRLNATQKKSL